MYTFWLTKVISSVKYKMSEGERSEKNGSEEKNTSEVE